MNKGTERGQSFLDQRAEQVRGRVALPESPTSGANGKAYTQPPPNKESLSRPRLTPVCVSLSELLGKHIPPRAPMLAPWLTEQSLSMIYAWRGIGKSWLGLSVGYAVASGCDLLGWHVPSKRRVLYIDGELPARVMQSRMALIVRAFDGEPAPDGFRILTPDLQPNGVMPNLSDYTGQAAIDLYADESDLIVIDNLSTLARGGKENEGESWLPVQEWALRHRAKGRAVLFIHHAGKGGQQRGASRREDVLDTVISLRRPTEYNPADGAVFELHFEKARNLTGDEAQPLDVRLLGDDSGIRWEYAPAEEGILDRLDALVREGASRAEMQDELGLSRFALGRLVDKANACGRNIILPDSRKRGKA